MADSMIIDSFAGGGGASTGIELALGRSPDVAINHSVSALALHAANHPETLHLDSNIWDVEPRSVTNGRHVGLLWASPDCKHFSKAKGGAVRDRNIRDLAWVVVKWAEDVKPDVILMENVEEFQTWGPIGEDGQPIKEFAGITFLDWISRLKRAGYKVQHRELRACDYGAPTIRKRWFLVARRDGRPITWPKPTHGDPKSKEVARGKLLPWRTAAECIDWSLPCPSIFDSKAEILAKHSLRAIRPLKPNTLARIARGISRYVIEAAAPFLVSVAHGDSGGRREYPLTDPYGVVLAGGVSHALLSPSLTRFNGGATGQDLRDPMATVTANSWIKKPGGAAPLGLIAPSLLSLKGTARRDFAANAPHPTVLAGGGHSAVVAPVLTYAQQGGASRSIDAPHHTICASRKDQNSVMIPHLMTMRNSGKPFNGADEPTHTITAGGAGLSLIAASMIQTGYGERAGQDPRSLDIGKPLGTAVAGGVKHAPIAAFLAQHNSGPRMGAHCGHDARAPISTIAASGSHQMPVAAWFAKYYGTGDGSRHDEPCHTVTVKDRFAHMQASMGLPPFTSEHHAKARAVADLLRSHGLWDEREFVTVSIGEDQFVIVDIGMRMLTPRELFRAQGFPEDYVIEGVWEGEDPAFRSFPKDVQISCCGNSVCPPLAEALVRANCKHLATTEKQAAA